MKPSIGIIGGSIAALTAAIDLNRKGFKVQIFERNKNTFESRGAGIVVSRSLLDQKIIPGLLPSTFPYLEINRRSFYTKDAHCNTQKKPLIRNYQFPVVAIHWGHLYHALREQVSNDIYHAGELVTSVSQDQSAVYLQTDQNNYIFDYVISADGINSALRQSLFPDLQPSYAGYTGWRGICEDSSLAEHIQPGSVDYYLYQGGHIVLYRIPAADYPSSKRTVINWVLYEYDPHVASTSKLVDKNGKPCSFSIPPNMLGQNQMQHVYDLARTKLPESIAQIVCSSPTPFAQAIYDLFTPAHVQHRCILLGDAAAIVRPHASSTTSKAMEGALALSDALDVANEVRTDSLAYWSQEQVKKANHLKQLAQGFGDLFVTSATNWSEMDETSTLSLWQQLMDKQTITADIHHAPSRV